MTCHLKRDCRVNLNKKGVSGGGNNRSNGSTPKEGQIISSLDNSTNYGCSLILESFYVHDYGCAWLTRELQAIYVGIVVGSRN